MDLRMLGGLNQMKKFFRVLVLGLMVAAVAVVPAVAQEKDRATLYKIYEDNYQVKTVEGQQKALDAAKEYVKNFNTPDDKAQVDYFNAAIPTLEKTIDEIKKVEAEKAKQAEFNKLLNNFDAAVKAKKWNEAFTAGKEIVAKDSDFLDVHIVLATIAYDRAVEKNAAFNTEAIDQAKKAIQMIESNKESKTGNYGAFDIYQYKTKDFPDGKSNALGWMNYIVGYVMYNQQDKKKEALPYLYKATQFESATKNFPDPYSWIGAWYYEELARIDKERRDKVAANNNEDTDETNALYALEKGVAERGADAYARAYKKAQGIKETKPEYLSFLKNRLEQLYKFRFDNKTDGFDSYIATVTSKPFPNPTTAVEPVKEEPVEATTTTTSTTSTTPSTKTTEAGTANKASANTTDAVNAKTPANKKPRKR